MIPVRLELQNFLAYRSPQPIVLEGIHLACLIGANGAGKSSLLDAITWAIWGKARTRRDNDLVHLGASDMHVQIDFNHEGHKYRVLRRRNKRGSSGTGRLDLFSYDDVGKSLNDISESSITATQRRINDLLRLDYDTFVNSAFLQQGSADLFTTQQPAKRKQILSNILGLEAWALFEEAAKQKRDEHQKVVSMMEGRLSAIEEELAKEDGLKRDLKEAEAAHEAIKAQRNAAEKLLEDVAHAPADLKNAQDKKADRARRRAEQQQEKETVQTKIERQTQQIAEYQQILSSEADIEAGYQNLQDAREQSQALNDKLRQLSSIDEKISEQQNLLTQARTKLETERDELQSRISELDSQVTAAQSDDLPELRQQIAALENKAKDKETRQAELVALGEEDARLRGENVTLYETMNEMKERIESLKVVAGAECPLCGQDLTEAHRQQLLTKLEAQGKVHGDTYRANQKRVKEIEAEKKTVEADIKALADVVADLPRLQKREGELAAQHQAAEEAARQRDTKQTRLTEVERLLTEEDYAPDVRAQLTDLQSQKQTIGYDGDAHDKQSQALEEYRRYDDLHTQLQSAKNSLETLQDAHTSNTERRTRLTDAIATIDQDIATLDEEIKSLSTLVETHREREQAAMRLRTEESETNERVIVARQKLKALDAKREQKERDETRRAEAAAQHALYDELRVAFGKNGVPAMIIETAIPELEATANDLLLRMTDGRMAVKFDTQKEKVSGGTMETLDISISDELGTRGYEMYSGGEAFRINFAIRVALSKMLARRAGAHLETLFVDEGFGTQDADGRARLLEAINVIKDDFALILVITHIDDLKDAFPVHINIEKTPSGSTVSVT